jgi:hypothetical protein
LKTKYIGAEKKYLRLGNESVKKGKVPQGVALDMQPKDNRPATGSDFPDTVSNQITAYLANSRIFGKYFNYDNTILILYRCSFFYYARKIIFEGTNVKC